MCTGPVHYCSALGTHLIMGHTIILCILYMAKGKSWTLDPYSEVCYKCSVVLFSANAHRKCLIKKKKPQKRTYQWSIQKQSHSNQCSYTESQDERSPPAPSQSAAVTGRADQRSEQESKNWTEEPRQTVVLLWKTCTAQTQRQMRCEQR